MIHKEIYAAIRWILFKTKNETINLFNISFVEPSDNNTEYPCFHFINNQMKIIINKRRKISEKRERAKNWYKILFFQSVFIHFVHIRQFGKALDTNH